jgi:hypothetical protein
MVIVNAYWFVSGRIPHAIVTGAIKKGSTK